MDKYEYKIRADEIKQLIADGDYAQAAEVADGIDWRRVKSVMMLCTISDLYKINRRYEDARDMLLLAYERRPGGRTICYSLCELSIKMEEFVQAVEYYKEFVQVAPKDPGRFILQYKLYEAQDVSLEERIEVLEELKKRDYREKWAYELAYLYHRVGLATRCVEECDEMILWFGEGRYVLKAMELKMLHQPLTPEQQEKYDNRFGGTKVAQPVPEKKETYVAEQVPPMPEDPASLGDTKVFRSVRSMTEGSDEQDVEEMDIHVKTMDVGQYNTINLQAELAAGLKEVLEKEKSGDNLHSEITKSIVAPMLESDTESLDYPEIDEVSEDDLEPEHEEIQESEVFFGETGELSDVAEELPESVEASENAETSEKESDVTAQTVMQQMRQETLGAILPAGWNVEPPKELAKVLSQESDGQISFVVPENDSIEKQITGQMNIEDILSEWERMKKANEEKRKEEVRQHVLEQTGTMFTEFEAAVRDGLLEQLENGAALPEESPEEPGDEQVPVEEEKTGEEEAIEEELTADDEVEELEEIAEDTAEDDVEEDTPEEEEASDEEDASEEEKDEAEETVPQDLEVERDKSATRGLTREERELYAPFIQSKKAKEQLVHAVDNISMAAYTGNVIITGEEGIDTLTLAKNMIREIKMTDSNFSGKVAKISGSSLNEKSVSELLDDLNNGALIILKASEMNQETAESLCKALQQETLGIVIVLEDTRKAMNHFLETYSKLKESFTARMDVEALSNDRLVAFGRQYAREREYSIDEMGVLALHTRIDELQTSDHVATVVDVKEIVDEAIRHANKKTLGHFMDVLMAKRYDDEDMIVLGEKDFA